MAKLKALITPWHTPHQYDLCSALKEDIEFDIVLNHNKSWKGRPIPEGVNFVPYATPKKYDFVILNMDQQLINPGFGKSKVFRDLLSVYKENSDNIIVLQHGGPVWPEQLRKEDMSDIDAQKEAIKMTKELIGDLPMIVNSYTAASLKEWGWGYPIVHGMNPEMWKPSIKEPKVVTALSAGGCDMYYNRACMIEVGNVLKSKYGIKMEWARVSTKEMLYDEYSKWLGKALIYVDTSFRTPMNRGRTEAMLSGCAVVQVSGAHDLDRFFKDGENIILTKNNPELIADKCYMMMEHKFKETLELGKRARENAIDKFSYDRYRKDWIKLLKELKIYA